MIFLISTLVAGCASNAESNREKYRTPTEVPGAASLTGTAEVEIAASLPPENCPVTVPQDLPFVPPPPYSELGVKGYYWYGSNSLWVALPQNGVWSSLPHDAHGYTQKIPWWREGYVWNEEPEPSLTVTGERLDTKAPPIEASQANGAYADEFGSAMMMDASFPSSGCWKITGKYRDAELSFVV